MAATRRIQAVVSAWLLSVAGLGIAGCMEGPDRESAAHPTLGGACEKPDDCNPGEICSQAECVLLAAPPVTTGGGGVPASGGATATGGSAIPCADDLNCLSVNMVCDTTRRVCVECLSDLDCGTQFCVPTISGATCQGAPPAVGSGGAPGTGGVAASGGGEALPGTGGGDPGPVVPEPSQITPVHIEAECAHGSTVGDCGGSASGSESGTQLENGDTTVGYFDSGDFLSFSSVDLSGLDALRVRYAKGNTGGALEVRLDSPSGTEIGSLNPESTGAWETWQQVRIPLSPTSGAHDVYLVGSGGSEGVMNFDSLSFEVCVPSCAGAECGDDGCGGTCGACAEGEECMTGQCAEAGVGLPPVQGGQPGITTRYWDCCKPHCAWPSSSSNPVRTCDINNVSQGDWHDGASGCGGGESFQCWEFSPFAVSSRVAYGWAAYNSGGCGECYQLDFTSAGLEGKQMVVQVVNTGAIGGNQFDLLIPGGGVGDFDGCSAQWGYPDLGVRYGGFRAACGDDAACILQMCQAAFGDKPQLMAACDWYIDWFEMSNNPDVMFQRVDCPAEITNVSGIGW